MSRFVARAALAALIAAATGAASLIVAFNVHPEIAFEMDRDLPLRIASGFYPVEASEQETYSWTSDRAQLNVQGLDRRSAWRCAARIRGGRSAELPQPVVTMAVDGQSLAQRTATNDYETLEATAPARPARGLRLTIASSETFTPGPSDPRRLGVRVDRLMCAPIGDALVFPPSRAIASAAITAAVFGAAFGLIGLSVVNAVIGGLAVSVVQAFPLSLGLAPYTAYVDRVLWLAVWIAAALLAGAGIVAALRRPLGSTGQLAVACSALALFAKLLALLHPSKAVVDALFHAHRLDYILAGRYFFTQVMPAGIEFPYAIALYVFAAPWADLTRDHVALLRIVVAAAEAAGGLLLYWAVARSWRDARVGVWVVFLYHLLPVSYWVAGNANLTNAFGQSAALAAVAALIVWRLDLRRWPAVAGVAVLAAAAFLSHVSTFALLAATMAIAAALYSWRRDASAGSTGSAVAVAAVTAAILAIALYYGRPEFYPAYRSARDVRAAAPAADAAADREPAATPALPARAAVAVVQACDAVGWPMLVLAVFGAWRLRVDARPARLTLAAYAWSLAFLLALAFALAAPARVGQQRYALEFVARAAYAASPAVLVLAGLGLVWLASRGFVVRTAGLGLAAWALAEAATEWVAWIR